MEEFGRLVMRAKISGLIHIKIPDFGLISETVAEELGRGRKGNNCEEIGFKWNSATSNMQEQVQELMEKIGWKMKENPGPQYDVVIVK